MVTRLNGTMSGKQLRILRPMWDGILIAGENTYITLADSQR
jgi:hypothetical protein